MRRLAATGTLLIAMAQPGLADFITGERLQQMCKAAESDRFAEGMAFGFIAGVYDDTLLNDGDKPSICAPKGVTVLRLKDVACGSVRRLPASAGAHSAPILVRLALSEAWPCTRPQP